VADDDADNDDEWLVPTRAPKSKSELRDLAKRLDAAASFFSSPQQQQVEQQQEEEQPRRSRSSQAKKKANKFK